MQNEHNIPKEKNMVYTSNRCPETGKAARNRSRFHDNEAQRSFNEKLDIAKELRSKGSKFTANYLATHTSLEELTQLNSMF